MRWISLVFWILICFTVAGISSSFTVHEIAGWYSTLVRPSIAPPNWVFGPVWTCLYTLMAVAAWRASTSAASSWRSIAIILFLAQLALNFLWSFIFFHWHQIGWALLEVISLWFAILLTILAFGRVSRMAAWLMVPYLAWVSFASVLNGKYWQLNK